MAVQDSGDRQAWENLFSVLRYQFSVDLMARRSSPVWMPRQTASNSLILKHLNPLYSVRNYTMKQAGSDAGSVARR